MSSTFSDWTFTADLLSAVKLRDGHLAIPSNHVEAGVALGAWLHRQVGMLGIPQGLKRNHDEIRKISRTVQGQHHRTIIGPPYESPPSTGTGYEIRWTMPNKAAWRRNALTGWRSWGFPSKKLWMASCWRKMRTKQIRCR